MRTGNTAAVALAVAGVLVASGVIPVGGTDHPAAAAFPATGPMEAEALTHPDRLNHYVVHFPETPTPTDPATSPVRTPEQVRVPVPETGGVADIATLAGLSSRGTVLGLERDAAGGLVAVLEAAGGTPGSTPADPRAASLAAVPGTRSVQAVGGGHYAVVSDAGPERYAALPRASVVEDPVLSVFGDTYYPYQWALENTGLTVSGIAGVPGADVGAAEAWAKADGSGVLVAVVDGGMQITHPDLAANIWRNPGETCGNGIDDDTNGYVDDCQGWDFANNDATVEDSGVNRYGQTIDNTHATHVAGIIAAVRDNDLGVAGLAPRARILPVKLSDTNSWATSTSARGIRYAADMGADVINCSFGTTGSVTMAQIPSLVDAVAYAISKGSLVVAAAGNSNRDIDLDPTYPASLPDLGVLSVGASTNNDTRASFSNWGAASVDLFSPGWSILSTVPNGYGSMHGTSMAAPLASAAAALVIDDRPGLGAVDVKSLLMSGSTPVEPFAGLSVSGQRLDAGRVLNPSGDQEENDVSFDFTGFSGSEDGAAVEASVEATLRPGAVPDGARVGYRATLMTSVAGATYGVSGAEIVTEQGTLSTGADASVDLSPAGGYAPGEASRSLAFGYTLTAGDYALVTEAYSTTDGEPIGRPWAAFFTVAATDEPGPAEGPTTTTTAPATQPPGGTTPTTQPPAATTPTTQPGATTTTTRPGTTSPTPQPGATTTTTRPGSTTPTTQPSGTTPTTQPAGSTPTTRPSGSTPTTRPSGTGPTPGPTTPPPTPTATTTTTTRPPTTSPPPATTTTTTRPPTTTVPPTLPPPPAPETAGRLTVSSLDPRFGSTAGGQRIQITGRGFGGTMHVLFGNSPGTGVSVVSSTILLVTTPSRSSAGTVDVRVSTALDSVALDDAFTFIAPTPAPTPTPTTVPPATTPPTTLPAQPTTPTTRPPGTTTTTRPAGGTTPTTQPTVTTTTVPAPTTTTTRPPLTPTRRFTFGSVSTTRGSLQLRPLSGSSPLSSYPPSTWSARRCTAPACTGTRL